MPLKNVLVAIAPHVGGRQAGSALGSLFSGRAQVTVVESLDEDPEALRGAHVVLTALAPVTAAHLAAAPALELVQCTSHGYEHVDVSAARLHDVPVFTIGSSDAESHSVAEQTFALMLALAKQLVPAHNALTEGEWPLPRVRGSLTELSGKTLGIVGLGAIGREVARRAAAFGMTVVYASRTPAAPEVEERLGRAACRWRSC
nr:hypothetical protein GCM10020093_085240 [Planobispora longispora]